jgi:hypothetical protein
MAEHHWEKLEKPDEVTVDLREVEPPDLPPEFTAKYGDLLKDLTKALAGLACSGDKEGLHQFYRFMIWLNGLVLREAARLESGKGQWN